MFRAIVLGIVQGLTEFLPVSSSGHLVLVPYVLTWGVENPIPGTPILAFDVAIHLGTLLALVVYFRRDLVALVAGRSPAAGRRPTARTRACWACWRSPRSRRRWRACC
jgi:undecaprenyl-diphosphatase